MTLTVPLHNPQPQGRQTSLSQAWQFGLLLLALWVWGLMAGGGGMGIHTDISGSPLAATNASGNVVWKENYSAYGERQLEVAQGQTQWFHGKEADAATGLQYFGARYYDPAVGRFMGIDPVGFQEDNLHSFNRYAYGNNNPVRYLDPDGSYADIAIEALSLAVGLDSLRRNFSGGNYGAAAVDALGVAGDAVLTAIPVAPGAIGLGIKASREAGELVQRSVGPRTLIPRQGPSEMTGSKVERFKKTMKADGYGNFPPIDAANVDGRLIIIDGHHRAAAAAKAGVREVPVNVRNVVSTDEGSQLMREAAEAMSRRY